MGSELWEGALRIHIDKSFACTNYNILIDDASVDLIFAFQAAHHFGEHGLGLSEIARTLKPGGTALYLSEPVCSRLTYRIALARVNRIRDIVQENYLIPAEMRRYADAAGLSMTLHHESGQNKPTLKRRLYYREINLTPAIRNVAPGAATLEFRKARIGAQSGA